ncbi:5-formyltetrahydrofolate cyclo-ligase family-domain-containing protein [Gigaspora rosea]|uniref:5-formyltetrahydrofolate cyclo-ligase n=1 Tax=Gigaspora rosea TaxID=44941 RepID=A0A397V9P0_9GLOM|nr:5-formyltetrahydrofolate cyclo-ligase family-domain-containing protein [Gigaspora rosea]
MTPVRARKGTLRVEMHKFLNRIPSVQIENENEIVIRKVLESDLYQPKKRICVYFSKQRAEISTKSIIYDIFSTGKICYMPRWNKDKTSIEMVNIRSLQDYFSLQIDEFGFIEPDDQEREIATQLDLIIIPGMAYDLDGNRLSYNKEEPYNEYLAKCQEWNNPPKISKLINKVLIFNHNYISK